VRGLLRYLLSGGGTIQAGRVDDKVAAPAVQFGAARIQFDKQMPRFRFLSNRQKA
jgi:hypothetical protein